MTAFAARVQSVCVVLCELWSTFVALTPGCEL